MTQNNKKLFPKLKKKLKGFITDESGKITKKDAFGLSVGVMLLTGAEEALANICNHSNSLTGGATRYAPGPVVTSIGAPISGTITSPVNTVVNGHYSGTPNGGTYNLYVAGTSHTTLGAGQTTYTGHSNSVSHANHASHASHGSHGSHAAY